MILGLMTVIVLAAFWYLRPSPRPERVTPSQVAAAAADAPNAPERLKVKVLSTRPHDPGAFTQGLVLDGDTLFESTGLNGQSSLREADPHNLVVAILDGLPAHDFPGIARMQDMPGFADDLDDAQVAALATWLRQRFGGQSAAVTEAAVRDLRQDRARH